MTALDRASRVVQLKNKKGLKWELMLMIVSFNVQNELLCPPASVVWRNNDMTTSYNEELSKAEREKQGASERPSSPNRSYHNELEKMTAGRESRYRPCDVGRRSVRRCTGVPLIPSTVPLTAYTWHYAIDGIGVQKDTFELNGP